MTKILKIAVAIKGMRAAFCAHFLSHPYIGQHWDLFISQCKKQTYTTNVSIDGFSPHALMDDYVYQIEIQTPNIYTNCKQIKSSRVIRRI